MIYAFTSSSVNLRSLFEHPLEPRLGTKVMHCGAEYYDCRRYACERVWFSVVRHARIFHPEAFENFVCRVVYTRTYDPIMPDGF